MEYKALKDKTSLHFSEGQGHVLLPSQVLLTSYSEVKYVLKNILWKQRIHQRTKSESVQDLDDLPFGMLNVLWASNRKL